MEQIWGQNLNDKPAGSSRTAPCHILLLCNYMISLWICNRRHWECRLTCWWLGKVFMAYSNWVTVELSRLMGIASARSRVVRLNTHAVATRWTCREVGWLCIPLRTSYRKQQSESCAFQAKKWPVVGTVQRRMDISTYNPGVLFANQPLHWNAISKGQWWDRESPTYY